MNPAATQTPAINGAMQLLYAPIADELKQAENILQQELRSEYPYVDELVRHGFLLGGKRLRPALLLLAAKASGTVTDDHLVLAAVIEMIHTATLVHDDVLDEAEIRRHLATVNSRWDDEASILLGDFLFTHSFYLASSLESTLACRWIGRATNIVCEGELRQKGSRGNYEISEKDYFSIIQAKTAELCDCSCRLGAHYAGADTELVDRMATYGRYLGIAFQIIDDVLDLAGAEAQVGKSLGTDLDQQKPTLPIIRLLAETPESERPDLLDILTHDDAAYRHRELATMLQSSGCLASTRETATEYTNQAAAQLDGLPPSDAADVLRALTVFVVSRGH